MRIVELEARHVRIPLKRKMSHATYVRTETDNVVVRCVLSDGTAGFGEGVPRDYVTGETIDFSLDLLKRTEFAKQLDADCPDFPAAVHLAEKIVLAPVPGDDRKIQGNAARCAVELAVLDAFGRAFGEPLSRVTEFVAPELYRFRDRVQYSGVLTNPRGWKTRFYPFVYWASGFAETKIKVGMAGQDDPKRLKRFRRWLGRKMDVRVDANEAWSPAEVAARIRELEPFGVTSVEQPVKHEDVACLAAVRKDVKTPIMLDESLCGEIDAERAAANGWCDLFNIRLSKCGGFVPSLRLAQLAKRHGLGYQLGCQVGETAVLSAAGRHFATSVTDLRHCEGSYDRHLVRERLATDDITFRPGGWAPALTGSGLGIAIDASRLDSATQRKDKLI
ncbi:mandelate racemase muconate lactonizing enzyme family protein : Mandelate racemase/muconate lactonizing enzyme family protein OS=Rhodopirellula europaea 6C GN=RE6C_00503 PE=4 SV=1: MR_MLE_C [Gemmataceae bacterium]|nr:mandelate racemase muconate lactonizing enzyme family protein : Mandelate racemase/muconate lactonizing enzyme family protein OS=Rhodopirellula europaea 6C GN=RE6C_00503 PE=4 SV=1: MR_MLE_C [Gemmataceae bacterium]VTU01717.1 mandelate racemase muconate lactonizing enzyme family protein : Mandelate racemase/muconate lactonizing enzyme family protein OS=Rhodopirellula europaea 6C GN=RE6C_00503 PE=4 SV=1: MR_MLE_C [Gemmataceae bacterium]